MKADAFHFQGSVVRQQENNLPGERPELSVRAHAQQAQIPTLNPLQLELKFLRWPVT